MFGNAMVGGPDRVWPQKRLGGVSMNAGVAVMATIAALFFLMPGMDGRADGDFWWHIAYGQRFLERMEIPRVDWLSWTKEGAEYVGTQWLGQVLLALGWGAAGWKGTAALTWATTLAIVGLGYVVCKRELKSPLAAAAVAIAMTTPFWSSYARPQIFGFVCMAALVAIAEAARGSGWRSTWLWGVGVAMAMWTNLHGSFVVGVVYLGVLLGGEFTRRTFEGGLGGRDDASRWLAGAVAVALAATLLNPFGYAVWTNAVGVAQLQATQLGVITEWTPTALSTLAGSTFILTFLAILVVWGTGQTRPEVRDVVVALSMILLGMVAVRQTAFATIALVPVAARALAGQDLTWKVIDKLPTRLGWSVWAPAVGAGILVGQLQVDWRNEGLEAWQRKVFPVEATRFLKANGIEGRLFNEATAGGWMIAHSGMKVFIDGRLDLHRDFEYFDWFFTRQGAPGWEERLARTDPEVFVVQTQSPITSLLMQGGKVAAVYADDRYSVLLTRSPKFAEVIARHELKQLPFSVFDALGRVKPTLCGW